MTARIGSYTALERPDGGHRAAYSTLWRGEDDAGQAVCLLILPADDAVQVRNAVAAAAAVGHPHLLPVLDVVSDSERVAIVSGWPRGGRLLELVRRRGALTGAETLTVLIPLASALAALHRAGVRHGGVGAGSVFFDERGRPQLGALAVSTVVGDVNSGMPSEMWDVAPEVVRGQDLHRGPMTPAADVFSLGSVALYCLTGYSAWPADDPADVLIQSTAGVWPSPPDASGPPALVQLIRQMLQSDPSARPAAAELVGMLAAIGPPAPVPFGSGSVPARSSEARWGGSRDQPALVEDDKSPGASTESAEPWIASFRRAQGSAGDPLPFTGRGVLRARSARGVLRAGSARTSTHSPSRARVHPARFPRPKPPARAGIAALSIVLLLVVGLQIWVWSAGAESGGDLAGMPAPAGNAGMAGSFSATGDQDWPAIVTALDAARGRALAAADPELLDEVYVHGSAVAEADAATIRSLVERGVRVSGGAHHIDEVSVAPEQGANPPGSGTSPSPGGEVLRVVVRGSLPAYPVLDADGRQVGTTAPTPARERVLTITSTPAGFRISAVDGG